MWFVVSKRKLIIFYLKTLPMVVMTVPAKKKALPTSQ